MHRMTQEQSNKQLFEALYANDIDAVKQAIDNEADINARDEYGRYPIHYAARSGDTEMFELLLKKGADFYAISIYSRNIHHYAAMNGHTEMVELIRQHGGV